MDDRVLLVLVFVVMCVAGRKLMVVATKRETPMWRWQALVWFLVVAGSFVFLVVGAGKA